MSPIVVLKRRGRAPAQWVFVVAFALMSPAVSSGQVKVIMSGGFAAAYQEILPEFQRTTGITVTTTRGPSQGSDPNAIGSQLRRGVPADVVIMNREGLEELLAEGRFVAGTVVDVAQVPLGLAVRRGAPKPEIGTVDAFRRTLLGAKSISSASSAAIYVTTKLLPRLGVVDTVTTKVVSTGLRSVASGESDFAILPVSELLHAPGVDFVGAIPVEIQHISVFTAGIVIGSKELEASRRLIAFLTSENATAAIRKSGMEPLKSR